MRSQVPELKDSIEAIYLSASFTIGSAAMLDVMLAISGATTRTISSRTLSRPGEVHVDENSMKVVVDSQDLPAEGVSRSA